jgi:hypothetical protein
MDDPEALLRAAAYLKWFRDRAITADTDPPGDLVDIIVTLEPLADRLARERAGEDLEFAELPARLAEPTEPLDD